jgi:hypothetical protein
MKKAETIERYSEEAYKEEHREEAKAKTLNAQNT